MQRFVPWMLALFLASAGLTAADRIPLVIGATGRAQPIIGTDNLQLGDYTGDPTFQVKAADASSASVGFYTATNTALRWLVSKVGTTHSLSITNYDAVGTIIDTPLTIVTGTAGLATVGRPVFVNTAMVSTGTVRVGIAASNDPVISIGGGWSTAKFDSQGTVWTSRTLGGALIYNGNSGDRPEFSFYRGTRTYPEFTIRQHTTADTGGEIWAGPGTGAPTRVVEFASSYVGQSAGVKLLLNGTTAQTFIFNATSVTPLNQFNSIATTGDCVTGYGQYANSSGGMVISFGKSRGGAIGSHAVLTQDDVCGLINFTGSDGTQFREAAAIRCRIDGATISSTSMPGRLDFLTTPTGTVTLAVVAQLRQSGAFLLNTTTDDTVNKLQVAGGVLIARGTVATALPILDTTVTWNAAGVTFTAVKVNVTSTASAAASLLMDLQVGAVSQFSVSKTGQIYSRDTTMHHSTVALTNGAGASAGTLANAPAVGNPTKWIPIDDNGTTRYIPAW